MPDPDPPPAPEPDPIPEPEPDPIPDPPPVPEPEPEPPIEIPPVDPFPPFPPDPVPPDDPDPPPAPPADEDPLPEPPVDAEPEPEPEPPTAPAPPDDPEPAPPDPLPPPPDPAPPPPPDPVPPPHPAPPPSSVEPQVDAGFEDGLRNWNIGGVGDVVPTLVDDIVREGSTSAAVVLTGSQDRSELTLGGNGGGSGTIRFYEGDERFYGFSFNVREMIYGRPGAHNLVMQLKSDGEGSPGLALGLWDYQGKRGLWSHGSAMGGDRFLRPIAHGAWQDVVLHFRASSNGNGFYRVYLNGQLIDSRDNVNTIVAGHTLVYIKNGIYRNGGTIPGRSEIRLDAARLGASWAEASIR